MLDGCSSISDDGLTQAFMKNVRMSSSVGQANPLGLLKIDRCIRSYLAANENGQPAGDPDFRPETHL